MCNRSRQTCAVVSRQAHIKSKRVLGEEVTHEVSVLTKLVSFVFNDSSAVKYRTCVAGRHTMVEVRSDKPQQSEVFSPLMEINDNILL